jgi:hypothetical protein
MDVDLDERTQAGLVLGGLLAYVLLLAYAVLTGDPTATLVADIVFGVATLSAGLYLLWALETTPLSSTTAALLVGAGLAALGGIVTGRVELSSLSDLLFLAGVALYLLLRRRSGGRDGRAGLR